MLRVLQHHVEHRRRHRGARDAVLVDELHPQLGLEHRRQHDASAAHVGDGDGVAGDVAQREGDEVALVGLRLVLDDRLQHRRGEVAVGEHRALREARRPARVQQPRRAVLVDVPRRLVGRGRADDVAVRRVGRRDRRAVVDHHDVLDGRCLAEHRLDLLQVLGLHEQDARFGVVQDPRPLLGVQAVVEEREGHAGGRHAVVALDVLGQVLGEDPDPVAGCGELAHRVGDSPRRVAQLAERDRAVAGDDGRRGRGTSVRSGGRHRAGT